jgi:predicted  nucleic acid-binding Zn-ribbon protein
MSEKSIKNLDNRVKWMDKRLDKEMQLIHERLNTITEITIDTNRKVEKLLEETDETPYSEFPENPGSPSHDMNPATTAEFAFA